MSFNRDDFLSPKGSLANKFVGLELKTGFRAADFIFNSLKFQFRGRRCLVNILVHNFSEVHKMSVLWGNTSVGGQVLSAVRKTELPNTSHVPFYKMTSPKENSQIINFH